MNADKLVAAEKAAEMVGEGDTIGVGSGSTVSLFIEQLAKSGKKITAVPTSLDTLNRLTERGIQTASLNQVGKLRLTVDGADQVDSRLNLIKGGGGAFTREKIVAYSSEAFIVIVDSSKLVKKLGVGFPVPVEFVFDAYRLIRTTVEKRFGAALSFRTGPGKLPPLISDNGLVLGDLFFKEGVEHPESLEDELSVIPGMLENGLFTKHKNVTLIVGDAGSPKIYQKEIKA
jgi:ribose 5-phosphate isomerase A